MIVGTALTGISDFICSSSQKKSLILVYITATQSKKDSKDQESIQSSTIPVPRYQMGKYQITISITNKSQEVN